MDERARAGPGLRRAGPPLLSTQRGTTLVAPCDARWAQLLERASCLTEGALRTDANGTSYFGSSSLRVSLVGLRADELGRLRALAALDPHLRLRALRIACDEAGRRVDVALGTFECDVTIRVDDRVLAVDIDVGASVLSERRRTVER